MSKLRFNRRTFLVASGIAAGGLVVGVFGTSRSHALPNARAGAFQASAWLQVTPEDQVIFQLDKTEMGQGVLTSLTTIIAEELGIDPRRVVVEPAMVHPDFQDPLQITGGSSSVRTRWDALRHTGAQAREMLTSAAAARWQVPVTSCHVADGRVHRTGSDTSLSFGELATAAGKLPVPDQPTLKSAADYKYVGQSLRRFDAHDKSNGSAVFGIDVDVPGALAAVVLRCPHFGGKLQTFDATAAKQAAGVSAVVQVSSGVAIVADTYWHARKAAESVRVVWDKGPLGGLSTDGIRAAWLKKAKETGHSVRSDGDVGAAVKQAARVHEAVYEVPYLAHATMEPQNTTAHYRDGAVEVWSPNQGPDATQDLIADRLDIPRSKVTVHTTLMGGGFGRRGIPDFAAEAAEVARHVSSPVKVVWSREDDMQHDFYRPATYNVMTAALDAKGQAQSWSHKIVAPSMFRSLLPIFSKLAPEWVPDWLTNTLSGAVGAVVKNRDPSTTEGAADHPYAIANVEIEHVFHDPGVPLGFWRSVGHSQNAFVTEGFVDELAHAAGADPYQFRRKLLAGKERHLAVLDLAAKQANWGSPRAGTHQGIAVHESFGTVVAEVAEVTVDGGTIKVERVVCAVDCGFIINPDQVNAQLESAVAYGLTAALKGRITIKDGAVVQSNFHDYALLRMNEMPKIEVYFVPSTAPPGGIGEPGTPPIAPAVANAVFAATGQRLRTLPLTLSG